MKRNRLTIVLLLALTCPALLIGRQQANPSDSGRLTLDTIFTYAPRTLGEIQWQADGSGYFMLEPSQAGNALDLVRYDVASGEKTIFVSASKLIPTGATTPIMIEQFDFSADGQKLLIFTNSERVWRSNTRGDYFVLDLKSWKLRKLGGDAKPSTLMFAKFSPDGTRVGYVRENNIYVESLSDGRIKQLTTDGTRYIVNGTFDWVYEEELFCRDGWRWSPDGQHIAYWQLNSEGVKEMKLINNTAELYPVIISFPYPKAGEMNSAAKVGVVDTNGSATKWFDITGDPRNNYLPRMEWAASSDEVIIQQLNRLQNTDIFMLGNIASGKVHTIMTEKEDTWVDIAWGDIDWDKQGLARGDVEWIDGGKRFLWASERDGWRHVFSISRDGKDVKCITSGNYDLISVVKVDPSGGWIYFLASPENATQRYLYRAPLDGGKKAERLTPANEPGTNDYIISPHSDTAIHTYSSYTKVPVTDVVRLPQHSTVRTLIDNQDVQRRLDKLKHVDSEFIHVKMDDGVELDGWMMKPPDFDPSKKYPLFFYVYGEPWGMTAVDRWEGRNEMWHMMLAQQGYIVVSVDNRGTPSPRGKQWRKSIYRKIGIVNAGDQANAVRTLTKLSYVDASRVGIWGWSGGGSSSLNAIFRYPDLYSMAMAVAPVADIRYYDSIYQERYCGLPKDHPDEYKQSSPVTFVGQLKGQLLIAHGTGDDNVHFQGTEELENVLIAAGKQFRIQPYPNRSHGIYEGRGTTQHLYHLLTDFLNEKLPAGPP